MTPPSQPCDLASAPPPEGPPPLSGAGVFVVIPAFQEERVLEGVVRTLLPLGAELVVVDDGSTDGTHEASCHLPVHVLRHPVNLGQGAALQTGLDYALSRGARVVVTFDADGQHRAEDVLALVEPVARGQADVVLGSRFLAPGRADRVPRLRRWLLRLAVWFTRATTGLPLTDTHNGLRAFTREAAARLRIRQHRMAHASEVLAQVSRQRFRVVEVPVDVHYTEYSRAKGQSSLGALNILMDLIFR